MLKKTFVASALWLVIAAPSSGANLAKPFGIYFSGMGDPIPSLVGVNAAYNLTSQFRVNLGAGWLPVFIDDSYSFGGGIKYLFLEDSSFSPLVGIGLSLTSIEAQNLSNLLSDLLDTPHTVAEAQTGVGFDLGGGLNYGYIAGYSSFFPYLNLGWFF